MSIESFYDIVRMIYNGRGLESFNLFEDHSVEGSHSRRKLNDSKKCNSMISLGTKLTNATSAPEENSCGRIRERSSSELSFPISRLRDFCRYHLEPGP